MRLNYFGVRAKIIVKECLSKTPGILLHVPSSYKLSSSRPLCYERIDYVNTTDERQYRRELSNQDLRGTSVVIGINGQRFWKLLRVVFSCGCWSVGGQDRGIVHDRVGVHQ